MAFPFLLCLQIKGTRNLISSSCQWMKWFSPVLARHWWSWSALSRAAGQKERKKHHYKKVRGRKGVKLLLLQAWLKFPNQNPKQECTKNVFFHINLPILLGHGRGTFWLCKVRGAVARNKAFLVVALWNSLPLELRTAPSLETFRHGLMTFLFQNECLTGFF